jgi:protein NrfC
MIKKKEAGTSEVTRRDFLKVSGTAIMTVTASGLMGVLWTRDGEAAIPVAGGYLLVDPKKCQGCTSCMLACSLVHEGVENLGLARIQVMQTPFGNWPDDIQIEQCRQCVEASCVEACSYGALTANPEYRNVRMIDLDKCTGCGDCGEACIVTPSRSVVSEYGGVAKARKCDLCADTPYWKEKGGPTGKKACVEVCPVGAISFTTIVPVQKGDSGYKVNLRDQSWANLGYPKI